VAHAAGGLAAADFVQAEHGEPIRRAVSPQQTSSRPSTAKSTPARCRIWAKARATFLLRSSKAAAQPTNSSTSVWSPGASVRTFSPSAQARRLSGGMPHGLPWRSRLRSVSPTDLGILPVVITW